MKGLLALDIDGTLTVGQAEIPEATLTFLKTAHNEGWAILFVTGRIFCGATHLLKSCLFPYTLAPYNGSYLYKMPEKALVYKALISKELLSLLEAEWTTFATDPVLFSGPENNDFAFYRPKHFPKNLDDYRATRFAHYQETWHAVERFDDSRIPSAFPSLKCFGDQKLISALSKRLSSHYPLYAPAIRDPYYDGMYIMQVTDNKATKGEAIKAYKKLYPFKGPIIAAGDDHNDIPLFECADYKIAMEKAPSELKERANVVAENGIVAALYEAVYR